MSAFYLGVVVRLVALLNVEVLSAAQSMKTREFTSMKAQNGSILCATSTPDDKMTVRSRLDCYKNCMSAGCLCASGANYRMKDKLCEMYSVPPTEYQVDPDCTFYHVSHKLLIRIYIQSSNLRDHVCVAVRPTCLGVRLVLASPAVDRLTSCLKQISDKSEIEFGLIAM